LVSHLGAQTSNTDFGTQGPKSPSFGVLGYREALGQNGPQIWTRDKGLIKGRYLDFGATLGYSDFKFRFWDPMINFTMISALELSI
jgi:hypothetical protein